jgi:hypothetical protein
VILTATATDKDGDTASASISLGDKVGFRDDAPTITPTTTTNLEVDETTLATDAHKTSPLHLIRIIVQMVQALRFIAWAYQVLVYRVV